MECLSIPVLSKAPQNDLARSKQGCLADTLGLEGKMKLYLSMIIVLKKE
jgi:hypothetical protein